ncbi:MAG: amidohydrolase family protein [Pseudomonadales bacterium]
MSRKHDIGFELCDADNHYYETIDACTRHLPSAYAHRGIQFVSKGKRTLCLAGEKVLHFIPNPTFEPIAVPGSGDQYYRGQRPMHKPLKEIIELEESCRSEYRNPVDRVRVLDEQGIEAAFLFPTFGYGIEEALANDIEAMVATVRAFNRWLLDDWSFCYEGRLFAAPLITLSDPAAAVEEVEWAVQHGARIVTIRPAPAICADKRRSPGDPIFDPVWAAIAEADVGVAFHIADSGYQRYAADWGDDPEFRPIARGNMTMGKLYYQERPIFDTIAALVVHGVFRRHPTLRVASIENGALWLPLLVKKLTKAFNQQGNQAFCEPPIETLRRHLWVSPYAEDDFEEVAELIGVDRILFGSDWPHAECLAEPAEYASLLEHFGEEDVEKIMSRNFRMFAPLTVS